MRDHHRSTPPTVTDGPPPPPGVRVRPAGWADFDDVVSLYADAARARYGVTAPRREDLRVRWLALDTLEDTVLLHTTVRTPPSAYAAFEVIHDPDDGGVDVHVDGQVHPAATGRGLASHLLAIATRRAHLAAARHHAPAAVVTTTLVDGDDAARRWFAARGFTPIRHFLALQLDLHAPPPAAVWPAGVTCRPFIAGLDERRLWRVHAAAFADHPTSWPMSFPDFLHDRLDTTTRADSGLVLIAEDRDELVGFAICRAATGPDIEDGRIRDLGVTPAWRRHGVGMALLRTAFAAFRERGLTGAALDVDDVTLDGAAALYRRAGMRVVRRTDVFAHEVTTTEVTTTEVTATARRPT